MRLHQLRPSPAMVVALIALVFALGGTGIAATKVMFARNAGTVDNIHASRKPKPNRLLALNANGKLPASVLTLTQGPKGDTGAPGPKGATGAQGVKGDKGDTGAPGPTASSYAHSTGGTTITGSGNGTVAIDLVSVPNTGSMELHRGAITVDYNARLIATGTLALRNANTASEGAYCWLALNPQNSGGTAFYYWGVPITMAPDTYSNPLSVTDGVDVGPGTYNVGVACWAFGVPGISIRGADLSVVATAR